jgi:K+-transporting ATPase ATPase A chain
MTLNGWLQIALYCVVVIAIARPLGGYMTRVFSGERTFLSPVLNPIERAIYRVCNNCASCRSITARSRSRRSR